MISKYLQKKFQFFFRLTLNFPRFDSDRDENGTKIIERILV